VRVGWDLQRELESIEGAGARRFIYGSGLPLVLGETPAVAGPTTAR
jgi:hypothetical protein